MPQMRRPQASQGLDSLDAFQVVSVPGIFSGGVVFTLKNWVVVVALTPALLFLSSTRRIGILELRRESAGNHRGGEGIYGYR